ncbi:hypothetical protein KCH_77790 [Kitasatospora cheerisanensis KCTC 2395]|uniref:Uncharacterized protein n=1 Tax=Kitasatospora cheerisanensis KCTC 2395 TaxID=1348663 RepID=A0A066YH14_9ACTN|nr:hypothetical protein KCH_77790 [Kitasatospora cheerisanensis KCTC 2395]
MSSSLAPSEDRAAVLLDDRGRVWAQCPTGGGSDDLVLSLVLRPRGGGLRAGPGRAGRAAHPCRMDPLTGRLRGC